MNRLSLIVLTIMSKQMADACWADWMCGGQCKYYNAYGWGECHRNDNGGKCVMHRDCHSNHCNWKYKCQAKYKDGHDFGNVFLPDYRMCEANTGNCGYCGAGKLGLNKRCAWDSTCASGSCEGHLGVVTACLGTCKAKRKDGEDLGNDFIQWNYKVQCQSGKGQCGICGTVTPNGKRCSQSSQCKKGAYCDGVLSKGKVLDNAHSICVTGGVCRDKQSDNTPCLVHNDCKSDYCHQLQIPYKCRSRKPDGYVLDHFIHRECASGFGKCGVCGRRGKRTMLDKEPCNVPDDCKSGLCEGDYLDRIQSQFTGDCAMKCYAVRDDGEKLSDSIHNLIKEIFWIDPSKQCKSKKALCYTCGDRNKGWLNPVGHRCADSDDCEDGLFCGRNDEAFRLGLITQQTTKVNCGGICKKKIKNNDPCDWWWFDMEGGFWEGENESCLSGKCVNLSAIKTDDVVCLPKSGGAEGDKCMVDAHCRKDLWCKGGDAISTIGKCDECPYRCGRGSYPEGCSVCNSDESNIECGRHAMSFIEEVVCAITGIPEFLYDAGIAFTSCIVSFGLLDQTERAGPFSGDPKESNGILCGNDMWEIGKACVKDKNKCEVKLMHCHNYKSTDYISNEMHSVPLMWEKGSGKSVEKSLRAGGRRLLLSEEVDDYHEISPKTIWRKSSNRWGFGSYRRRAEGGETDEGNFDMKPQANADEISDDLNEMARTDEERKEARSWSQDVKDMLDFRNDFASFDGPMKATDFDGMVTAAMSLEAEVDPDVIVNVVTLTSQSTIEVAGSMAGEINFEGSAGKFEIQRDLSGPMAFFSDAIIIGDMPLLYELYIHFFVWIDAEIKAPINSGVFVEGDFTVSMHFDVDLKREGEDKFRTTKSKGEATKLVVTPNLKGDLSMEMNLKSKLGARLVLVLNGQPRQLDVAFGAEKEFFLHTYQQKNGDDCVMGVMDIPSIGISIRGAAGVAKMNPKRMAHAACIAGMGAIFSKFSKEGWVATAYDCAAQALIKESPKAHLYNLCHKQFKAMPDEMDVRMEKLNVNFDWITFNFLGDVRSPRFEADTRAKDDVDRILFPFKVCDKQGEDYVPKKEDPPHKCADEGKTCECVGKVYYGHGKQDLEAMIEDGRYVQKASNGKTPCTNNYMGRDPLRKVKKQCICVPEKYD